ncbi:hypothetical protein PSAR109036_03535 [Psychrobacter arenosus]
MTTNRPAQASYCQNIFYFQVYSFNFPVECLAPLFSLPILAREI